LFACGVVGRPGGLLSDATGLVVGLVLVVVVLWLLLLLGDLAAAVAALLAVGVSLLLVAFVTPLCGISGVIGGASLLVAICISGIVIVSINVLIAVLLDC